jgi:hypothetical protein
MLLEKNKKSDSHFLNVRRKSIEKLILSKGENFDDIEEDIPLNEIYHTY